jgi:hypothetical protein
MYNYLVPEFMGAFMRFSWLIIIFILSSSFIGCAKLPSREVMQKEIEGFELPKRPQADKGMIYILRPSSLGGIVRFNVHVDSKEENSEIGYTRGGQYLFFDVSPGQHEIWSNAENWGQLIVNVEKGKVAYIKQNPKMGIMFARNKLSQIDEVEGKYHVKKLNLGTFKEK